MSELPEFLTVEEAAELLRVNRKTLYAAIAAGQVPGVVRLGRVVRLARAALVTLSPGSAGSDLGEKE